MVVDRGLGMFIVDDCHEFGVFSFVTGLSPWSVDDAMACECA